MTDAIARKAPPSAQINPDDDMFDSPEEIQAAGALKDGLTEWAKLKQQYGDSDKEALHKQSLYRMLVTVGVFAGCAAVILAVVQLLGGTGLFKAIFDENAEKAAKVLVGLEAFAALSACGIVIWGLSTKTHEHWLLERHRAERMRLLKFRSLLELASKGFAANELAAWNADQDSKANEIQRMKEDGLKNWISVNSTSYDEFEPRDNCLSNDAASDLLKYFRRKRLSTQRNYFSGRADLASAKNWGTRKYPAILLLASFAFAFLHAGLDIRGKGSSPLAYIFVALAACLPVAGSAIRTYRNAYEFARNSLRFKASLNELDFRLGKVSSPGLAPKEILKQLWRIEDAFEREHREWLRLMVEAEWYG
jgi:membrane protease YdiL (CAAX protease family)